MRRCLIQRGNPVSGGAKYTEGEKILRFSTEITVYLENDTGLFIGWRFVSVPMTLNDPGFKVPVYLQMESQKRLVMWTKLL